MVLQRHVDCDLHKCFPSVSVLAARRAPQDGEAIPHQKTSLPTKRIGLTDMTEDGNRTLSGKADVERRTTGCKLPPQKEIDQQNKG